MYGDGEIHIAYMIGDDSGKFHPNRNLTRAEAAIILARMQLLGFEHGIGSLPPGMASFNAFADVGAGQWFYYYLAWAYDAGLVQGYVGNFRPHDPITREEFAALIVRAGPGLKPYGGLAFADGHAVSEWALAYIFTARSENLMVGDPNGNFRPQEYITRAETATAMNRLLGRIDSRAAMDALDIQNNSNMRHFPDVSTDAWYFPAIMAATNNHMLMRDKSGVIVQKSIIEI